MAINGVLGRQALGAGTDDLVYTVPEATFSVVTISVTNRNAETRSVRIALTDQAAPADADYIEYDTELLGNGTLERTGVVLQAGYNVFVRSNSTAVTAVVYGLETETS